MSRYLIAGSSGQLARAFIRTLSARSLDFLAPEESGLDITDAGGVGRVCKEYRPDVILNCAAYNLVDKAEEEPGTAMKVNAEGPQVLARAAKDCGARLVHFGSDYVFDGQKQDGLYTEEDAPNPLNEYGRSKLRGEELVRSESEDFLIFRLSWVYGDGTQNFLHKLLGWASDKDYLSIVCDEFSVPTCTYTVADVTLRALEKGLTGGIFHLTDSGYCSRYEWARLALRLAGINKFIRPVGMSGFDLPATRPGFSAMSNTRVSESLGISIPSWEDSLGAFMKESR